MTTVRTLAFVLGASLLGLGAACGSSGPTGPALSFTPLNPWDGGAEAACSIGGGSSRVGCAVVYPVTGNPYACQGFADGGAGTSTECQAVCGGLVCSLSGLSNGTNVVDCQADCASPEH